MMRVMRALYSLGLRGGCEFCFIVVLYRGLMEIECFV